jgi:ABC-type metal ion transport system substrate-binding protein
VASLAFADVALGNKEESIQEARRAMKMLPMSEDALDGPIIATNFALVCGWSNQMDLAFEQHKTVAHMPNELITN